MRLLFLPPFFALLTAAALAADGDSWPARLPPHPRLLVTDAQLAAAKETAQSDPLMRTFQDRLIALAEKDLTAQPPAHVLIGPRMLAQSRKAVGLILTEAMAYRLTGDARYLARARRDLLAVCNFPDWHPAHFLDVAEMSFAVGIGYDWLYPSLSPEDRAAIERALVKDALSFAGPAYVGGKPEDSRLFWVTAPMNWNQVCNAGLLTAALAVGDEEPGLAQRVVAGLRRSLPLAMAAYRPDGACPEGPGYWAYGTTYNVIALDEMEGVLGTDFGLAASPAFDRTAFYRLAVQSPTGLGFNYADGGEEMERTPALAWLARRFGPPAALARSRELLRGEVRHERSDRFAPLYLAWWPPAAPADAFRDLPLDLHFRGGADLALFRSAWEDSGALFVGFKAGSNAVNHAHLDLGSFVLDADGVRWAMDLGPDDYNLPGYFGKLRWTYYRLNNFSHNTITPGGLLQSNRATAPIVAFASAPDRAYAIADLTEAYPGASRRLQRGLALLDRARVLIEDEWVPTDRGRGLALHWGLVTPANIRLAPDGRSAELTFQGRALRAEILAPAGVRWAVESTRPEDPRENPNAGTRMLAATLPSGPSVARLAVLLSPEGPRWLRRPPPPVVPLAAWGSNSPP